MLFSCIRACKHEAKERVGTAKKNGWESDSTERKEKTMNSRLFPQFATPDLKLYPEPKAAQHGVLSKVSVKYINCTFH
jgi:hypothetical protein